MVMDPSGLELLAEPGRCLERDARGGPYQPCDPLASAPTSPATRSGRLTGQSASADDCHARICTKAETNPALKAVRSRLTKVNGWPAAVDLGQADR